jgi:hypothetical protein
MCHKRMGDRNLFCNPYGAFLWRSCPRRSILLALWSGYIEWLATGVTGVFSEKLMIVLLNF